MNRRLSPEKNVSIDRDRDKYTYKRLPFVEVEIMSSTRSVEIIRHIRDLAAHSSLEQLTDRELLQQFVEGNVEAFTLLVNRHAAMVWSVCRRSITDRSQTEDAFQATFLSLLQSVEKTNWRESIAGWLHCVAVRICSRLRAQRREQSLTSEASESLAEVESRDELTWREMTQILDREVQGLPERYRTPILLCYFEGLTNSEAAAQLGWSRGTLSGRLSRARKLLRKRLSNRGITSLAALLSLQLASAMPATILIQKVIQMSNSPNAPISQSITSLVAPQSASLLTRLGTGVCLALTLLMGGTGFQSDRVFAKPPKDPTKVTLRERLFRQNGGTAQSRKAIDKGLAWLAKEQRADGSWTFPNRNNYEVSATAFGLLPFLGDGISSKSKSKYAHHVKTGLDYLLRQQQDDGSFPGILYIHAVATHALCEASQLEKDVKLRKSAQRAVDFIAWSQHVGGGWRYQPRKTPGDTSVTIWMLKALHSARLAGLKVPPITLQRAGQFLTRCEDRKGGFGYTQARRMATTTAYGLLGRLYLGGDPEQESFRRGLQFLGGPGETAFRDPTYHHYFASELRFHVRQKTHQKYWTTIRDRLIKQQNANGSFPADKDQYGKLFGPLFVTSLAIQTLEAPTRLEWALARGTGKPAEEKEIKQLWASFIGTDQFARRKSVWRLSRIPNQALKLLRTKVSDRKSLGRQAKLAIEDLLSMIGGKEAKKLQMQYRQK